MRLINFTELNKQEHRDVLSFRNRESIRKWMYNSQLISENEHFSFVKRLKSDTENIYFLVQNSSEDIGVIYFNHITKESAEFGLYSIQRGVGLLLMQEIIKYAKEKLQLSTLRCEVFKHNEKAISLYKKAGLKTYKESSSLLFMHYSM